ncbi:MAG: hypothetical protein A3I49_02475 [Candidatus Levybacteria bacterium RIFCSPLOWO2_02_FULL_37_11]|nr:MAG: hypothetical protein A3I49_02475 [Candidatus Levybacteria bacterium RIFCSPLOWO2_02_FULL_37_11]
MAEDRHENVLRPRKHIFFNNFLGGFAWGLGATIGLSVFLAVVSLIGKYVDLVPVVGNFVSKVLIFVLQNNPQLIK